MYFTIDRFEGNFAVCEDRQTKKMTNVNIKDLPKGVKEGDIVKYENGKYSIDIEETERIRKKIRKAFNDLLE